MVFRIPLLAASALLLLHPFLPATAAAQQTTTVQDDSRDRDVTGRKAAFDVINAGMRALREERYAEHLRELLGDAVRDRLRTRSDAIGIAMSGGLDSCSVGALARRELRQTGRGTRLIGCSFVFDRLSECDERPYIRSMSSELDFEVAYVEAERFWFLGDPVAYRPSLETPFMAWDSSFHRMLELLQHRVDRSRARFVHPAGALLEPLHQLIPVGGLVGEQ